METKEFKISIPEGYEIDEENSTLECIKFKPIVKRFRDDLSAVADSYFIQSTGDIRHGELFVNLDSGWSFATEKQAKSVLAMAKLSQIIAHDERFGGPVTDEEWNSPTSFICIVRANNKLYVTTRLCFHFLAFHTYEQAELFLQENEDLIKDYLMID